MRIIPSYFLKAIIDEPGDDTHRLVFSDWLEENGLALDWCELIRIGCWKAQLPPARPVLQLLSLENDGPVDYYNKDILRDSVWGNRLKGCMRLSDVDFNVLRHNSIVDARFGHTVIRRLVVVRAYTVMPFLRSNDEGVVQVEFNHLTYPSEAEEQDKKRDELIIRENDIWWSAYSRSDHPGWLYLLPDYEIELCSASGLNVAQGHLTRDPVKHMVRVKTPVGAPLHLLFTWNRGFPCMVQCKVDAWIRYGPRVVRETPVTQLELTDFTTEHIDREPGLKAYRASYYSEPWSIPTNIFPWMENIPCWYNTRKEAIETNVQAAFQWAKNTKLKD